MTIVSQKGQGLLEALIAVSIIVTALSGVMALASQNLGASQVSSQQVVGINLAREAVEIVRNMRDSNWLSGSAWDTGFASSPSDKEGTLQFDPTTHTWTMDYTPDDYTDEETIMYRKVSPDTFPGTWQQGFSTAPANSVETEYKRLITINPICSNQPTQYSNGSCGANLIGYRIYSEVQWTSGKATRSVAVQERIFDWK